MNLQVSESRGGAEDVPDVTLRIEGVLGHNLNYFRLENPNRLVIDIPGINVGKGGVIDTRSGSEKIRRVRIGSHEDKVRIVVDLAPRLAVGIQANEDTGVTFIMLSRKAPTPPVLGEESRVIPDMRVAVPSPSLPTAAPEPTAMVDFGDTPKPEPSVIASGESRDGEILVAEINPTPLPATPTSVLPSATPVPTPSMTVESTPAEPQERGEESNVPPVPEMGAATEPIEDGHLRSKDGRQAVVISAEKLKELARVNFAVDKVLLIFKDGERPVQDVVVKNPGSKEIYVSALTQSVQSPGTPEEKRVETASLLVSPRRFSVPPNGSRTVRVLLRDPPLDIERAFNIAFSVNRDSFESEYVNVRLQTGDVAKLRVVTNLGILVLAEPPGGKVLVGAERKDGNLILSNRGNVSVRLTGGKLCEESTKDKCISVTPRRLYPGNDWAIRLPENWSAYFIKDSALGFEQFFAPSVDADYSKQHP